LQAALAVFLAAGTVVAAPAEMTTEEVEAEARRLRQGMRSLSQKNAWKGVESKYDDLMALPVEHTPADHRFGADAARALGSALERRDRLVAAGEAGEVEAQNEAAQLSDAYGRLYVLGNLPVAPATMPFDPDPRRSIVYAQDSVKGGNTFWGMLPVGDYTVGPHSVQLQSGLTPLLITRDGITKLKDPFDKIGESGDLWTWNGVDIDNAQLRAILRTRRTSASILEAADRARVTALGMLVGGVVTYFVLPLQPLSIVTVVAAIPLGVWGNTGTKRALAAWKRDWAASAY